MKEYKEIYIDKTFKGDACPSQEWYFEIIKQDLDKLEKLESELKRKSGIICMLESENESLHNSLEKAEMLLKHSIDNNNETLNALSKQIKQNNNLKQVIDILKDKIELPLEDDFDVVKKDEIHLYRLRTKCLINEEEYDLLKEVFENEKERSVRKINKICKD